jgi:hypothetical protein
MSAVKIFPFLELEQKSAFYKNLFKKTIRSLGLVFTAFVGAKRET